MIEQGCQRIRRTRAMALPVVLATLATGVFGLASPSSADVPEVKGSAYGYTSSVSLFGGPYNTRGFGQTTCTSPNTPPGCAPASAESPSVELPPTGGSVSASDPDGATAQYGPAIIFSSGAQEVSSEGTTGPDGSVTTSATVADINRSGDEMFTAVSAASTCTASESGVTALTTITNGVLRTSEGDPNVEGDETFVDIPTNPEPNTFYQARLESVGGNPEWTFNEQVVNPDGSITVYAAHLKLTGPSAFGDLFIGKSECGVTSIASEDTTTTTTDGEDTTTTTTDDAPPPVVPESPLPLLLPVGAIGLFAGAAAFASRRLKNGEG
jgi:hypothetical protein